MISILSPSVKPRRGRGILLCLSWILMISGLLSIGYVGLVVTDALAYQRIEMRRFESERLGPAEGIRTSASRASHSWAEGDVLGELQIPSLKLRAMVVEGDSPRILRHAVGHVPNSALPGETGNVALAGHRDSFFRPLRQIRRGDVLTFRTLRRQFRYQVQSIQIVSPDDITVLRSEQLRELTLITCFPFNYVGPAPYRFIVRAREMERAPTNENH